MDINKKALLEHERLKGKIGINVKFPVKNSLDLAIAYTPGVAEPCREIARDRNLAYKYTMKGNSIAVVTDGSRVLGLGNIGAEAALPVMEGKCLLFKQLANIDAFPICIGTQDPEAIIETVKNISPVFGGINLEDIEAPKCFYIEERLKKELDIPVVHDDQHGTATAVLAGLINALKVTKKRIEETKVVINGAGAAGIATANLLLKYGIRNITIIDSSGAIYKGRKEGMNSYKEEISKKTNTCMEKGSLAEIIKGKDVFIGLSAPKVLSTAMVRTMNKPIIFALANPIPEIMPEDAKKGGALVIATGRSDYPNQINNSLCFPGIFRGTLDSRAKKITDEMKIAAAEAIASLIKPTRERIIVGNLDKKVVPAVSKAVYKASFGQNNRNQ
ncbi:NADP-dependent malic enzyme [Candidatus Woesearchaeota archaeon]|nr:NADP-dependent malic enzyme [Candidatus Woesearchaeota archaeon]